MIIEPRCIISEPINWTFKYWSLFLSRESWSKCCERRRLGLVTFITTLMECRQSIFVDESNIDLPIFLLFFKTKFSIFPIFSILSFLFSYFFEHPWCWTPWRSDQFDTLRLTHVAVVVIDFRCECFLSDSFFLCPRKAERGWKWREKYPCLQKRLKRM